RPGEAILRRRIGCIRAASMLRTAPRLQQEGARSPIAPRSAAGAPRAKPASSRYAGTDRIWERHVLKLYSFGPAANSLKPLLTLYEKGLGFEGARLDPSKFEQHSDWFKAIN